MTFWDGLKVTLNILWQYTFSTAILKQHMAACPSLRTRQHQEVIMAEQIIIYGKAG